MFLKTIKNEKVKPIVINNKLIRKLKKHFFIYLLLLPAVVLTFFFCYLPMPGLIIAFMEYDIFKGFSSPFVGLTNIKEIFTLPLFQKATLNTLKLSILNLIIVFPAPIIFALLLNEIKNKLFKRFVQTVSYLPHFLSWIAIIGIMYSIYSTYGIINDLRVAFGGEETERIMFLSKQALFVPNVIILSLWKGVGWSSIIYLSAISGINPELYESAFVDGAGKFKQCIHITIPGILPTAVMLFILAIGNLFKDNFDLIYGLQNAFIDFETISTLVYKQGIVSGNYSMATALGFVQGVVGFILVAVANKFSKKVNDVALW
jgi:putative aldouronate transport system permease protein